MGFLWDLVQQSQISQQRDQTASLDQRMANLERELDQMRGLVQTLIRRLETSLGEDIDRDGRVG